MIPPAPLGTEAVAGRFAPGPAAGVRPGADSERRFRFELAAHPGSVAQARRMTRARLSTWAVCENTCDTAALVVSELVTNAIVHAAGRRVVCELHDGDDLVRIAVRDEGCAPGEPHPSSQRPEEEHGRGLLLVAAMCHAWGAQDAGSGLLVWADLPRTADDGGPDTAARSGLGHTPAQAHRGRTPTGAGRTPSPSDAGGAPTRSDPGGAPARSDPGGAPARSDLSGALTRSDLSGAPARSDLGWGAKKPPPEGEGDSTGTESSYRTGTGAAWA
ncbi:ATP-binding protein [Streptomyces sp. NPDC002845]